LLRARFRSAHDHTPYHQQTLGISCLPWPSPSVSVVSSLILLSRPGGNRSTRFRNKLRIIKHSALLSMA
jgi:hypothetical protein